MLNSAQTRRPRRSRKPIHDRQMKAMKMYLESNATSKQIAKRFGVSPSTLTCWAKNLGAVLRIRGSRRREEPNSFQKQILRRAWCHTYETVGRRHGMKKQSIGRLVKRWRTWAEHKFGPRLLSQRQKAGVASAPRTTPKPYAKGVVVCFRLTPQQTEQVREVASAWGFGNRLSNGVACRVVLLSAVGLGKFELSGFRGNPHQTGGG